MPGPQEIDHAADGIPRPLHQVRTDSGRNLISLLVKVTRCRPLCLVTRKPERRLFYEVNRQTHSHRAFDCSAAHLTVALGRVRIPKGQQSTVDLDRQVQHGTGRQIANIHIATDAARGHHTV